MKKLLFVILFISTFSFAQVEKKVGDFNKVTSFDKFDVMLIASKENKVIISGKEANDVEVVNKNGELKLKMPLKKLLSGDDISITVYFKKIDAVEANEGSRIACNEMIKSNSFEIIAKEGSEIKLQIETQKLSGKISNGSNVTISGKATNQDVLVNSGGVFDAEKLITEQTTITCNAGGKATIYATTFVEAKVRAGGEIKIHGKPKEINQKVIAGGSIDEVK